MKVRNFLLILTQWGVMFFITSCDFSPRIHKDILLGQEYINKQEYQMAATQYEKILKNAIDDEIKVKILYQLGELYSIHLGKNKKALEFYERIGQGPFDLFWVVKAHEKMGELNFTYLKDYKKSFKNYQKLASFRPRLKNQDLYQYREALSLFQLGYYPQAQKKFSEMESDANHKYSVKSLYYLGLIKFKQKKWAESIIPWKSYIKKEVRRDNVIQTKFLMANAYETLEKLKEAYDLYYSLLGDYPNSDVIQNRLNSLYNRRIARKR